MRLELTILMMVLNAIVSFGQITTTSVVPNIHPIETAPYDSLENFLNNNVNKYIGQDLYLNGRSENLHKFGYHGFVYDYNKGIYGKTNVYKCSDNYTSKYEEVVGKYFKVLDVIAHPKAKENDFLYGKTFYLKLLEKDRKDTIYYTYDSQSEHSFPFIVVGYWEKYKKNNMGKQFVLRYSGDGLSDIKTGEKIEFTNGSTWSCVNITIEDKYYKLVLLFHNDKGQEILSSNVYYLEKSKADNYRKKFGNYWPTMFENKVEIGMTSEMCKLSWGEPKSINETITSGKKSEQWVYSSNFLYFENGILTAIQ